MARAIPRPAALAAAGLLSAAALPAAAQEPINIAALYNISSGGLASLDGRMIELQAIDTMNDTSEAATAAKRAVSIDELTAGIGQSDTTFALAVAPLFQSAGIPFVTSGATSPELPTMVGEAMFLTPFGDDVQAYAMAEYAYETLDIQNIAVWTDNAMDYTTGLSRYFTERFEELGGTIALEESYMTSDQDFSALVSRLDSADDVDAVFASSGPDTAGVIVRQIREAGIDLPILAGDGFDTELITSVPSTEQSTNIYFTTHAYAGLDTGPAETFRSAYEEEYGTPPENAFAALGYDAMGLVADAISRAESAEPDAVREALANTESYEAVTGTIAYPEGSRVPSKPVAIMAVEEGEVALETTLTPSS